MDDNWEWKIGANLSEEFNLETESICVPNYIAVEGAIGVENNTEKLASSLNYDVILEEPDENPFLEKFYRDKKNHALSVQLHFISEIKETTKSETR